MNLAGKTAIVTGATGGLGAAVVRRLLHEGLTVAAAARSLAPRSPLPADEKRLLYYAVDLTVESETEKAFDKIESNFGAPHLLVHLVGAYFGGVTVRETPFSEWKRMMDLNLTSAFLCCRAALRRMKQGGSITVVAAESALRPKSGTAAYAAAKTALITLMRVIAEEGASQNIRANAIAPNTILTEANRRAMPDADTSRWTTPEEIAETILFLAKSDAVSGTIVRLPLKGVL